MLFMAESSKHTDPPGQVFTNILDILISQGLVASHKCIKATVTALQMTQKINMFSFALCDISQIMIKYKDIKVFTVVLSF